MTTEKKIFGIDVARIFIGIQRTVLTNMRWYEALRTNQEVCIPCRSFGWQNLSGRVIRILEHREGHLIALQPTRGSLLQSWRTAWIWVPRQRGSAGVLNVSYPHLKSDAIAMARRGTTISIGQAIDNGRL